jgi:hypothetical protein
MSSAFHRKKTSKKEVNLGKTQLLAGFLRVLACLCVSPETLLLAVAWARRRQKCKKASCK